MPKVPCSLCQTQVETRTLYSAQKLELPLFDVIKRERPEWPGTRGICGNCYEQFRAKKLLSYLEKEYDKITEMEKAIVTKIARRGRVSSLVQQEYEAHMTFGEHVADRVAQFGGSWTFIVIFGAVLFGWMGVNTWLLVRRPFDPYPFILLNLVLSTIAALQAPVIMMSQNRQAAKDRFEATQDSQVNLMAAMEIRDLHDKLDGLRHRQWHELWHLQRRQLELLEHLDKKISHPEEKTADPGPYRPPEV